MQDPDPAPSKAPPRVPPGRRIYAIGDIHGRADLLNELHQAIAADAQTAGDADRILVYLGDFVDRGRGSSDVLDMLINDPLPGLTAIHLLGNHERMMLDFLKGPPTGLWLFNGGVATLYSYGIGAAAMMLETDGLESLRLDLEAALPATHLRFLNNLRLSHIEGDYCFVHAGLRPGRPLAEQREGDLLWIREPFLDSTDDLGYRVVHGHTIHPEPQVRPNRIGIDTGAVFTHRLTALVLEDDRIRFLHT
jgi:serine/threonine protein phosphatase 1